MKKSLVYILLALASIIWGVSFIMTKELFVSEPHITVFIILTFRLLLATAVTIPVLLITKRLEPIRKGDLKWFLLLALCEPFIYSICETSGVQLVSGSMASIIVATIPLFVPFGMALAYKEKIKGITLVGIILSLIGLSVMLLFGGEGNLDTNPIGLAWLAGAVLIAVVFTIIIVKLVDHYRPITITAYQNLFGCLYFLPCMLLVDGSNLPLYRFYFIEQLFLLVTRKKEWRTSRILCEALGLLCFAFAHLYLGWISVLNAALAHIFLRLCFKKFGKLWPCVASHFIYNVISLILL